MMYVNVGVEIFGQLKRSLKKSSIFKLIFCVLQKYAVLQPGLVNTIKRDCKFNLGVVFFNQQMGAVNHIACKKYGLSLFFLFTLVLHLQL